MDVSYESAIDEEPSGPFTKQELSQATNQPIIDWWPIRWILYIVTSAGFWCTVLPITLVIVIGTLIYRLISRLIGLLTCRRATNQSINRSSSHLKPIPLSALDSIWTHDTSTNRSIITALLVLDGNVSIERLRQLIDERIVQSPGMEKLRYSINLSTNQWEPDQSFDLNDHVYQWPRWKYGSTEIDNRPINPAHYTSNQQPVNQTSSELDEHVHESLESLISSIINQPIQRPAKHSLNEPRDVSSKQSIKSSTNQPIDQSTSLWSFSLLPRCGRGCAVVFRAHHSLADGVLLSGVLLKALMDPPIDQSTDQSTHESSDQPSTRPTVSRLRHFFRLLVGSLHACLTGPYSLMSMSMIDDDYNTFHCQNVTSTKRVAWINQSIDMIRIKRVRKYYGCSVNDVMMSVLLDAMHGTMIDQPKPQPIQQSTKQLVNQLNQQKHLHLIVPINIRGMLSADSNNQSNNQSATQLGNLFAVLLLKVGLFPSTKRSTNQSTCQFPSPRSRLLSMTRLMNRVKTSSLPLTMYGAMSLTVMLLPTNLARFAIDSFNDLATAIMTNNRSPETALYLNGQRLLYWCSWAPCRSNCAMSQTILTYNQEMRASFVIDAKCKITSSTLTQQFMKAFQRLEATVPKHFMQIQTDQPTTQPLTRLTNKKTLEDHISVDHVPPTLVQLDQSADRSSTHSRNVDAAFDDDVPSDVVQLIQHDVTHVSIPIENY